MSDFGLTKESVQGLGPGAYLVNVLPSAVLVTGTLAVVTSHLYPWADPLITSKGTAIPEGPASVLASLEGIDISGGILLAFSILFVSVLLRPYQITAVQILEGYWHHRRGLAAFEAIAIERHLRRIGISHATQLDMPEDRLPVISFSSVAHRARQHHLIQRRVKDAQEILDNYPEDANDVMPTHLGNILKRAETSAGERYGLNTVLSYPRLFPYLSAKLGQETETQLNVIDSASSLTIITASLAALTTPFIARFDGWSALPAGLAATAMVSYSGARLAARRYALVLSASFDLHRFDMLAAMHRRLPRNASEEFLENQSLNYVLAGDKAKDSETPERWRYVHGADKNR